jgi:N-acylneuraminate cytidylyltransferase
MTLKLKLPTRIQAIIFDFDGVFTDNRVIINENGEESVICNRGDGLGISLLKTSGILLLVVSKEKNPVVQKRCEKMEIPCIQGVDDKKTLVETWLQEQNIDPRNVVYVGNDVNDIKCLKYVGCGVVVADAHPDAKSASKIILNNKGGQGAVRELCDMVIIKNKGK